MIWHQLKIYLNNKYYHNNFRLISKINHKQKLKIVKNIIIVRV